MSNFKILYFLLLSSCLGFAQKKSVLIVNANKQAIEGVNALFSEGLYAQSDKEGKMIFANQPKENVVFTHLGYDTLKVAFSKLKDTLILKEKSNILNEVVISKKTKRTKLFPKKYNLNLVANMATLGTGSPLHYKEQIGVFVPNEDENRVKYIQKVFLRAEEYESVTNPNTPNKNLIHWKKEKYAPFKVNLYTADSLIGIPSKKLFEEDFVVQLKLGEKYAVLELTKEQQLQMPNGGVFVVISSYDKEYYERLGLRSSPYFEEVVTNSKSLYKQYRTVSRYGELIWVRDDRAWKYNCLLDVGFEVTEVLK
jgi:hypothetical protein